MRAAADSTARIKTMRVEFVLLIDGTATMWPYIDRIRSLACSLPSQIIEQIRRFGATDLQASVQRVMFRDLERDAVTGIEFSTVFDLHADHNDMVGHLNSIELDSNRTTVKSGLTALAVAFGSRADVGADSDVDADVETRRVFMLWTDGVAADPSAERHLLQADLASRGCPTWDQFVTNWNATAPLDGSGVKNSVLVLFAPERGIWTSCGTSLESSMVCPSDAGDGVTEKTLQSVVEFVARAIRPRQNRSTGRILSGPASPELRSS